MTSINNDAGEHDHDSHPDNILHRRLAAARRAAEENDPVDARDVQCEIQLDAQRVIFTALGVRGRVPRQSAKPFVAYAAEVDVHEDLLPEIDLDEIDIPAPIMRENDEWWLLAGIWWGLGGQRGGGRFFNLPDLLKAGLSTLFREREEDLEDIGLTMADQDPLRRRLLRILVKNVTLVTQRDPLLDWAPIVLDERTPTGQRRPIDRFQRIVLAELVNRALDLPAGDLRGEHAMRLLDHHTHESPVEKPDAEGIVRRDTLFRRLVRAMADAQLDGDPRWDAMTLDALRTIGRDESVEADRAELHEAITAAWTHEDDFGTDRLDVTLVDHLDFDAERVAVVIERVRKEVLPHIK